MYRGCVLYRHLLYLVEHPGYSVLDSPEVTDSLSVSINQTGYHPLTFYMLHNATHRAEMPRIQLQFF